MKLLTMVDQITMYLYIHKKGDNEIQQAQLLEMCRHAGFSTGNGETFDDIITSMQL